MKIIISPFPQKLKGTDKKNPKCYPHWIALINKLLLGKHEVIQVGIEGEEQLTTDFRKNLSFKELKELLLSCDTFICTDNFFQHFAHLYGKRGIVIWGLSDPKLFGYPENVNLLKDKKYLRPNQFQTWHECEYIEDAFVPPIEIINNISEFQ
jgi:ADP-heptose:LPS heptosyltransferase